MAASAPEEFQPASHRVEHAETPLAGISAGPPTPRGPAAASASAVASTSTTKAGCALATRLRPFLRRNDFGTGLVNGKSDGGGLEGFGRNYPSPAPQLSVLGFQRGHPLTPLRDYPRLLDNEDGKLVIRLTSIPA